jgi:hypothetical protein
MKFSTFTILLLISITSNSQSFSYGLYQDNFGSSIKINEDGTFQYIWRFDLSMSWTKGTWLMSNDTFYFSMTPIFDTLAIQNHDGFLVDTLFLSEDEVSNRIPAEYHLPIRQYPSQNSHGYPDKLFYKKYRLYEIQDNKLIKKKRKGFWTKKKHDPWYFKSEER